MAAETFLITGAYGCIGAWVVRQLLEEGARVVTYDLSTDPYRLRQIMPEAELARVQHIAGDVTDSETLGAALREHTVTHIIHLAALQVPACKARPALGAKVNVMGTANVFACAAEAGIEHIAYASSIAVFGPKALYDAAALPDDAVRRPDTLYGVYKVACEDAARVFWQDAGVSSIALRPYVVYGVGRDQGMTASPTFAMRAAAKGEPYTISYTGRTNLHYVADVAALFIKAARTPVEGALALNVGNRPVHMTEVVEAIQEGEPGAEITIDPVTLPFPEAFDDPGLQAVLGPFAYTPLREGVRETVARFKELES